MASINMFRKCLDVATFVARTWNPIKLLRDNQNKDVFGSKSDLQSRTNETQFLENIQIEKQLNITDYPKNYHKKNLYPSGFQKVYK